MLCVECHLTLILSSPLLHSCPLSSLPHRPLPSDCHCHCHYSLPYCHPRDKRNIVCDAPFKAAFECDTMTIFTMNKYLTKHLLPADPPAC